MNTPDRELLELAAKAMGVEETYPLTDGLYVGSSYDEIVLWNPLTDDGDAAGRGVRVRCH